MKERFLDGRLSVRTGDITLEKTDVIVNAANVSLLGGGGVDGAIHRAGGSAILMECHALRRERYKDGLPTGEAVETTAGKLAARWVIHTVGPVWRGGRDDEERLLASCYNNCLELAARLGAHGIAFPAISTGVYHFPREKAAEVVWNSLASFFAEHAEPREVRLVFYSADDTRVFLQSPAARQ